MSRYCGSLASAALRFALPILKSGTRSNDAGAAGARNPIRRARLNSIGNRDHGPLEEFGVRTEGRVGPMDGAAAV